MKILMDVGNSRLKWAELADSDLSGAEAVDYRERGIAAALAQIPQREPQQAVWVASVAGQQVDTKIAAWAKGQGYQLNFASVTSAAAGVTCGYRHIERLGVDRWLAVLGAYHRASAAALVVDAGTALTLDVVDAQGQHLGGLITPGVRLMREAVHGGTQVRTLPVEQSGLHLGTDTAEAVGLGTLQAALGLVERLVVAMRAKHGTVSCYLTGGEAEPMRRHLDDNWQHVPHLVLEGLALLAKAE